RYGVLDSRRSSFEALCAGDLRERLTRRNGGGVLAGGDPLRKPSCAEIFFSLPSGVSGELPSSLKHRLDRSEAVSIDVVKRGCAFLRSCVVRSVRSRPFTRHHDATGRVEASFSIVRGVFSVEPRNSAFEVVLDAGRELVAASPRLETEGRLPMLRKHQLVFA